MTRPARKVKKVTKKQSNKTPAVKPNTGHESSSVIEEIRSINQRLNAIESRFDLLNGITREYLEENFAKIKEFEEERKTLIKAVDSHESRINSLEGF